MKSFTKYLCLCLAFLLPFAAHAKFTGEVIFRYPGNDYNELWITHIENAKNPRLLYKHNEKEFIYSFAIQKDGPLIAISAGPVASNIFLIDRNRLRAGARNLTENRFNTTKRVDISPNGDILFTNTHANPFPEVITGLYFMPNDEVKKVKPQATLLKEGSIVFFRWSPDSEQFIYLDRFGKGLFLYNLLTGEDTLIANEKMYPVFSPDGKKLAFIYQPKLELDVISLETMYPQLLPNDPNGNLRFSGLKWPEEKYLVYRKHDRQTKKTRHFVIRIDGSPPEQILEDMEDMFENGLPGFSLGNTTFAVEPTNRLTTLWGKLKTLNTKSNSTGQ
jgi:Tol biopolymer transport system component